MNDPYCKTHDTLVHEAGVPKEVELVKPNGEVGARINIEGVGIGVDVEGALMRRSECFGRTQAIVDSNCSSAFDR